MAAHLLNCVLAPWILVDMLNCDMIFLSKDHVGKLMTLNTARFEVRPTTPSSSSDQGSSSGTETPSPKKRKKKQKKKLLKTAEESSVGDGSTTVERPGTPTKAGDTILELINA